MNELPLQSLASKDPDDTQGLARTTIKVLKTNMVEKPIRGSSYGDSPLDTKRQNVEVLASENSSLETTVTKRKPNIVEDPNWWFGIREFFDNNRDTKACCGGETAWTSINVIERKYN